MSDVAKLAAGLSEVIRQDITVNWDAFSDADPLPHFREYFPEALERAGYAELVLVDQEALSSAFAWDRGIEPGGMMWRLTPLGKAVRQYLTENPSE